MLAVKDLIDSLKEDDNINVEKKYTNNDYDLGEVLHFISEKVEPKKLLCIDGVERVFTYKI